MNKLSNYFEKINNLSHAFLIGNVLFDEIEEDLKKVISEKILKNNNINLKESADIYYYDQYEKLVTKEEIKQLLNNISTTSQFNNAKIYIINGAEKLSAVVYNAILKTLEEPENNIYAFLVTKNIEAVKETIKSRCQIIYINTTKEQIIINEEYNMLANKIIKNIEENNIKAIAINSEIYTDIENREHFKKILQIMLTKYNNYLNELINNDIKDSEIYKLLKNNDIITLSKKILVIDNYINLLDNYLNKNLMIDRFIIEMWRCVK